MLNRTTSLATLKPTTAISRPTEVLFGEGRIASTGELLDRLDARSVVLVADPAAYEQSGASRVLEPILADRDVRLFTEFSPNPKDTEIAAGAALLVRRPPDVLLAVGGGSALDTAKLLSVCATQKRDPREVILGTAAIDRPGLRVIAVPTTAGTGAEATHFAVVYVDGVKCSPAHPSLLPAAAIVDPKLTWSMPPPLTASSGLDALCQAVESFWAVGATAESQEYAREALRLALEHLEPAVNHPSPASRAGMAWAAHLAGRAINISKTTASHAISYALTSKYGLPHGMAVAVTLGPLLVLNSQVGEHDCVDPRGATHVRAALDELLRLFDCRTPSEARERITRLLQAVGCPTSPSEGGVRSAEERQEITSSVNVERLGNNPRRLNTQMIESLLENAGID
ncbi:MAG TPA: alcohol dehydrogenase [Planctomycetaceae bacterium]|nr:alcohol dehydrogenase [Planctomycetaceae bacterium]